MTTLTKSVLALVGAVIIGGFIWGAYSYPKAVVQQAIGGSPAGSSFLAAKVAEQSITTGTTTTFSMLNTDANDRSIVGFEAMLAGAMSTTTTTTVKCATSTNASTIGTGYIVNTTLSAAVYGTTTGTGLYIASSSPGLTGTSSPSTAFSPGILNPGIRNWTSGTYLNCAVTTSDTFSGFGSSTTGWIGFPYRAQ